MIRFNNIYISFLIFVLFLFMPNKLCSAVFEKGETIQYEVKKLGIKLGDAWLKYKGKVNLNGNQMILVIFAAKGFNFLDEEKIYLDSRTLYPLVVKRDLNIFGKKEKIIEVYDQKKGNIDITKSTKKKTVHFSIKKGPPIDNIYGFIFRYREYGNLLKVNKINLHLPTQDVSIKIRKKMRIKLSGKEYEAFFMKGKPKKLKIWFDVGPNKIPLRIDGSMGIGNTTMSMVEYSKNGE